MKTDELRKVAGDIKILDKMAEREMYSHDIGELPPILTKMLFKTLPDLVVQPKNIEEIQKVIEYAGKFMIPVVTRGAASWGFGGVIPAKSGIIIDLSPFRKILSLDTNRKTVTVEAGARWGDIDTVAKKKGLCLMTYPSSKFSTVGGWVSTGGFAINSYKYGHLSRQVISLTVVTGTGEVKKLSPADRDFSLFFSSEGEFGIIVEVTLKLRDVPQGSYPHILYFKNDAEAFRFVGDFVIASASGQFQPNTIRFVDENHLTDTNEVMRTGIFKKSPAILMEFAGREEENNFLQYLSKCNNVEEAPRYVANYLWNERLFGMKTKRLGPTILASEVVIAIKRAADFIAKAKKIGGHFGVEVSIDSYIIDSKKTLVMANFLCDSRKKKYFMNVPLVAMLTRAAVSLGAEPYGLGLWNAAFVNDLYNKEQRRELKAFKARMDPNGIYNPGKPFSLKSKGLAGLVFHPAVFRPLIQLLVVTSPVIGKVITALFGKDKKVDKLDYELSIHACAKCGNCMAVCPAYLVTNREEVTAKGKIAIARKLLNGQAITNDEANAVFMCMRCKACEDICQTNLELMKLWEALEERVEGQFGRPVEQVEQFLTTVDASQEYWAMVEQNN